MTCFNKVTIINDTATSSNKVGKEDGVRYSSDNKKRRRTKRGGS